MLHCIAQLGVVGGENTFSDGFMAEAILRQNHPEEWRALSTLKVEFNDEGSDAFGEFYKIKYAPIFT